MTFLRYTLLIAFAILLLLLVVACCGGAPVNAEQGRILKKNKGKKNKSQKASKSVPTDGPCAAIASQKDALLALKAGFADGDTRLSNWDSATDPCDGPWTGITCDGGEQIAVIFLLGGGLGGGLGGTISPLIGCPPLASSLTQLVILSVGLTGTIPPQLGSLTSLTSLNLSYNSVTGTIPAQLGALTSVTEFGFSDITLTGSIPSEICDLFSPPGSLTTLNYDIGEVTCDCCPP